MIENRVRELGIVLPHIDTPRGSYIPAVVFGDQCWSSGQLPFVDGEIAYPGRLGEELTIEDGQAAARIAVMNAVAAIRSELGSLDRIARVIRLGGFVNSTMEFDAQHLVVNGASEFLHEVFGERGRHVRTSVATQVLPFRAAIEVELVVGIASVDAAADPR